jgi:hypothetical protein
VVLPETVVDVNFGTGNVDATLDFSMTASAAGAPVDVIELRNMQIGGNRFSGGTLTSRKGPNENSDFSAPSSLASSGVFAGPGAAELGGVFYATFPDGRLLTGRYIAAR